MSFLASMVDTEQGIVGFNKGISLILPYSHRIQFDIWKRNDSYFLRKIYVIQCEVSILSLSSEDKKFSFTPLGMIDNRECAHNFLPVPSNRNKTSTLRIIPAIIDGDNF